MKSKWRTEPLRNVVSYIAKGIPPAYVEDEGETTVRVLNQKCNRDFAINYEESRLHDVSKHNVPPEKYLRDEDILINSTGKGTAGRVAQLTFVPCPTVVDGHMIVLRPNEKLIPRYLGYSLKAHQGEILQLDEGSTGQTELNRERLLSEIIVSYPVSLAEQRAIADTLSALDARIDMNRKINHHLEQMAQTIFKSWFIEFEPFGGLMPDNWRQGVLSDITPTIYSGGTPSTGVEAYWNGNIPWLSSGETRNHFIIKTEKLITQNGVDNSSTRIARRHDIVMASAGQGFTRGQTSLLLLDTYVNQSVIVMSGQNPLYLFFNLSGRYDELRAISDSSSSRGSITTKMLAQLPMLIPSNEVISEFTTIIVPLVNQIENNLCESTRLVELRDTLLPRLMSGEVSVADIDAK